jgi:hypothetical protein
MKLLMTIALLAATLPATAENWVRYAQSADLSRYYDKERVLLMSGTAFIWDLHDLRAETAGIDGKPHRSVTYATEVNCRKELMRVLSYQQMAGGMGAGPMVAEQSLVGEWKSPAQQSAEERLMAIACEQ